MTLELTKLTALEDSRYQITVRRNRCATSHIVTYRDDFVPRLTDIDDELRPVLINHPRATQEIIKAVRQVADGLRVSLPLSLTVWQDEPQPSPLATV
jgi:hypothetical protein